MVFWSFWLKIISCGSLFRSGLKFLFHWDAQLFILAKPLFNLSADLVMFYITENSDVSSANSFSLDLKLSVKSFVYIRKNNGSSTEPCRTPDSIAVDEEYCPFRKTLCFRWYKKSFTVFFTFMMETFVPNLIQDFWYVKKYTSSFIALIKRFINLMCNR